MLQLIKVISNVHYIEKGIYIIGEHMKLIRPNRKYIQSYIEAIEEDEIFRPHVERIFNNPETIIERSYNFEHGIR